MLKPGNDTLRKELLLAIDTLEHLRTELATITKRRVRKEVRRIWFEVKGEQLGAPIVKQVCEATNENGKAAFANETLRKAEIVLRLSNHPEIGALIKTTQLTAKISAASLKYKENLLSLQIRKLESLERLLFIRLEEDKV